MEAAFFRRLPGAFSGKTNRNGARVEPVLCFFPSLKQKTHDYSTMARVRLHYCVRLDEKMSRNEAAPFE